MMRSLTLLLLVASLLLVAANGQYPAVNDSSAYVNQLANCTNYLVQYSCETNGCPYLEPTQDILTQCQIAESNSVYANPCSVSLAADWSYWLHITAVFVVLVSSSMGAGIPIFAKYHPGFSLDPYYIMLGKCMGIGVVLACGLIHMLQPSSQSLTSPCVPWEFNTDYNAYAFLYAMLAILALNAIDLGVEAYFMDRLMKRGPPPPGEGAFPGAGHGQEVAMVKIGDVDMPVAAATLPAEQVKDDAKDDGRFEANKDAPEPTSVATEVAAATVPSTPHSQGPYKHLTSPSAAGHFHMHSGTESSSAADLTKLDAGLRALSHSGHVHSMILVAGVKRTVSAYMIEFGVSVHSLFIGLANGIDTDDQLHVLLVALVFHQMFEGIALGSRIADANLPSHWHEALLTTIFSLAAPFGIAVGIAVKASLNSNGETFLLVQGTFDGVCGGILIYIGLVLLLRDFPEDMTKFCKGRPDVKYRIAGMFIALYIGAGLMAFIGKYL